MNSRFALPSSKILNRLATAKALSPKLRSGSRSPILRPVKKPAARPTPCRNGQALAGTTYDFAIRTMIKQRGIQKQKNTGCQSIFMSVESSMRFCTFSMPVFGIKFCMILALSSHQSRSKLSEPRTPNLPFLSNALWRLYFP